MIETKGSWISVCHRFATGTCNSSTWCPGKGQAEERRKMFNFWSGVHA